MLIALTGDGLGIGVPVSTLTPAGLLAVVIILIAMGRLVPRRTLEDVIKDRDEWRAAHRLSEQSRAELAGQVGELLELARTADALLRALPYGAEALARAQAGLQQQPFPQQQQQPDVDPPPALRPSD